jgi:hypothetical protein
MRPVRLALACALLFVSCGVLLGLSGCGSETGPGGVKVGGAQTDPSIEARDKEAAAQEAALQKK